MIEPKVNESFIDKQYEILCERSSKIVSFNCSAFCCFSESKSDKFKTTYRLFCHKCHLSQRKDGISVHFTIKKCLFNCGNKIK